MILATTKQRILYFIEKKNITKSVFYEKTDIKRGLLDKDKLDATVSDVYIAKILASFPDLNIEWLITGQGEMLKQPDAPTMTLYKRLIPLYPIWSVSSRKKTIR